MQKMKTVYYFVITIIILMYMIGGKNKIFAQSQYLTKEDSFNNDKTSVHSTILSGYGEINFKYDNYYGNANMNLARGVLFVGHKFNSTISFFSELELESAKVQGGASGGEIAFEQLLLKFNINRNSYILAGLLLPRIGLLNEDHLPINYFSVERPLVEALMLGNTWREIGVAYYSKIKRLPLNVSFAVLNGLNSEKFSNTGFSGGRGNGQNVSANNLALAASIRYYDGNLRVQLSQYYGGTSAMNSRRADSLKLESGIFGCPINIGTLDFLYQRNAWSFRGLMSYVYLPQAQKINQGFANLVPELMYGTYIEAAYDLLFKKYNSTPTQKQLYVFTRYEKIDYNAITYKIANESIKDDQLNQHHIIAGLAFLPIKNVIIKVDIRFTNNGKANLNLTPNISPIALAIPTNNTFLNIGIGYAF